jgi:hypothetical protein
MSPEAKRELDGATLMPALLELKAANSCGMFVSRMQRSARACAFYRAVGPGKPGNIRAREASWWELEG